MRSRKPADSSSCDDHDNLFPEYIEASCPQQQNSNDCGMYVLAVTRALCDDIAANRPRSIEDSVADTAEQTPTAAAGAVTRWELSEQQEADLLRHITPAAVTAMRKEILLVIDDLSKKPS